MDLRYYVGPVDPVDDEIVGPDLFAAFWVEQTSATHRSGDTRLASKKASSE